MMTRLIAIALAIAALGGCESKSSNNKESLDFGAAVTASTMHKALAACAIDGFNNIKSCAAAEKSKPSRLTARVALETQSTFTTNCNEALGVAKCADLLTQAYLFPSQ
jgi:hypothetical protein